jgi:hypothetical protein
VRLFAGLGATKLRVTSGEPLLRVGLPALIRRLADVPWGRRPGAHHERDPAAATGQGLAGGGAAASVGASRDDDGGRNRGAVWVLFLNADGTVKDEQKISSTQG